MTNLRREEWYDSLDRLQTKLAKVRTEAEILYGTIDVGDQSDILVKLFDLQDAQRQLNGLLHKLAILAREELHDAEFAKEVTDEEDHQEEGV